MTNRLMESIVVITTVLTLIRPITAGFGGVLGALVNNNCHYTACESYPKCAIGYDTLSTTREGCSGFKEKKYCCSAGSGPQCYFTGCSSSSSCGGNYRELDRTKSGCSGFSTKAYCCKLTDLPYCFDLSCPAFSESKKSCPAEYLESRRVTGRSAGCDSAFAARITCCLRGCNGSNGGGLHGMEAHGIHGLNSDSNADVISETNSKILEDGSVQTVTRTQSRNKATGFSGGFHF